MTINLITPKAKKSFFTAAFRDTPKENRAVSALNGPTLHTTLDSAINEVWRYVQTRLFSMKEDFLVGSFDIEDHGIDFPKGIDPATISDLDFTNILNDIAGIEKQRAVNWYFDFMEKDNDRDSFYKIDEHAVAEEQAPSDYQTDIRETTMYKNALKNAISEVIKAAADVGVSTEGFVVDECFCDFTTSGGAVSAASLAQVVDDFAFQFGKHHTAAYNQVVDWLCEDINAAFRDHHKAAYDNALSMLEDDLYAKPL